MCDIYATVNKFNIDCVIFATCCNYATPGSLE